MNYILLPSLEDIALIKLAISLWNPDDIRASMKIPPSSELSQVLVGDREIWRELEMRVREKIPHLMLHINLQEKLSTFVRIIGLQILPWLEYHCAVFFFTDVPNEFCWTPQGTIDCKKTAEVLIKNENIDITSRYILACIYCFREDIKKLWNKIPGNRRLSFHCGGDPREVRQHKLVVLWTYIIIEDFFRITDLYGRGRNPIIYAFEAAVEEGIKYAAQFYLELLFPQQREEPLIRSALQYASRNLETIEIKSNIPTQCMDFLCYLLSEMNEQHQRELIESYTHSVLYCFIHWPRQPLLMEVAKRAWDFLTEDDYENLLIDILDKMNLYKDYNYRELFGDFWRQSHDYHK